MKKCCKDRKFNDLQYGLTGLIACVKCRTLAKNVRLDELINQLGWDTNKAQTLMSISKSTGKSQIRLKDEDIWTDYGPTIAVHPSHYNPNRLRFILKDGKIPEFVCPTCGKDI